MFKAVQLIVYNVSPLRLAIMYGFIYFLYRLIVQIGLKLKVASAFKKLPQMPIIGPIGWLLGNIDIYYYTMRHLSVEEGAAQITNASNAIESLHKDGLLGCHLGFQKLVAFFRADTLQCLMNSSANKTKADQHAFLYPWLGLGLLTSTGDHWKTHRRLIIPAFHAARLQAFVPVINQNVDLFLNRIESQVNREIDIRKLVTDLTLDIISETAMGVSVGAQLETTDRDAYITPIEAATVQFGRRIMNPLYQNDFIYNLSADGKKNAQMIAKIHQFVGKVIAERRAMIEKKDKIDFNHEDVSSKRTYTFFDSLLSAHRENPREFTEKDIFEEVNTIMFAGHETTAMALTFSLLLIAGDVRVQEKIVAELRNILDEKNCPITVDHCREMRYLEMAIKESLRLYTPTPTTAKKIEQDLNVNGHIVPAECNAVVFFSLLHRDPKVFPQPERFIPERFEPDAPVNRMVYAYMPFGAGPRTCLGQKYAMLEMKLVLAAILQKYKLSAITQRDQVKLGIAVVLKVKSPIIIRFDERDKKEAI